MLEKELDKIHDFQKTKVRRQLIFHLLPHQCLDHE